jgi:excisionase family DNA binding protein
MVGIGKTKMYQIIAASDIEAIKVGRATLILRESLDGHLAAMPNPAILVRLLFNQSIRTGQLGKGRRALDLYRGMTALAPGYGNGG